MPAISTNQPRPVLVAPPPPPYRVLRRIGLGGMSEVFLGLTQGVGVETRPIVIKRLRPELANERTFVDMFLDEARLSVRLRHPNVVRAFQVGWLDGGYYLTMEALHGLTLKQLVERTAPEGGLALPLSLRVVSDLLLALHYVHELTDGVGRPLGIVHGDVSPHNV